MRCGRCKYPLLRGEAEICWWCSKPLCRSCWGESGHCGHKEATRINELSREAGSPSGREALRDYLTSIGKSSPFGGGQRGGRHDFDN